MLDIPVAKVDRFPKLLTHVWECIDTATPAPATCPEAAFTNTQLGATSTWHLNRQPGANLNLKFGE